MLLVARTVATDNIQYKYYTERSVGRRRAMHSQMRWGKKKNESSYSYVYIIYIYKYREVYCTRVVYNVYYSNFIYISAFVCVSVCDSRVY